MMFSKKYFIYIYIWVKLWVSLFPVLEDDEKRCRRSQGKALANLPPKGERCADRVVGRWRALANVITLLVGRVAVSGAKLVLYSGRAETPHI